MNIELEMGFERTDLSEISTFENTRNIILPEDYRSFLMESNGGKPVIRRFKTIDGKHTSSLMLLFPVAIRSGSSLISAYNEFNGEHIIPPNLLAIGKDPIDNIFVFLLQVMTLGVFIIGVWIWRILIKEIFNPHINI
ncbi:SMI1/KNR4 family protein [Pseudogracilibacillus auburnensis]|uniref:SMI1/KNR4 family protein n=1 Tax=Pseudogracilibacillus auburnensis TaxID=1494959 RepID=UPI001A967030|nr:SMI1/KNR4 family protein [Pseudogracilibacillus auburnensis]MBO1004899.1 SMI1/KNR4 family protein [Pseudogracilibacillus auburnensis]